MKGRKNLLVVALLGVLPLLAAPPPAVAVNLLPGDPAPELSLPDIDGRLVTLDAFREKTVVIVFWSTWCSRCSEELEFLRDTFGARDDLVVLLVNQDSEKIVSRERIVEMRDRLALTFRIIVDSGLVLWDRFRINALPTSVVVGKDGRIVYVEPSFYRESREKILDAVSHP